MRKTGLACLVAAVFFSFNYASFSLADGLSDGSAVSTAAVKKTKKKHKKSKSARLKVAKSSAGSQDEVSDQTDVSQQADQSGNKKK